MAIINVLKDGTVVDDMTKVVVPKDIVQTVSRILNRKDGESRVKSSRERTMQQWLRHQGTGEIRDLIK